MTSDVQDMVEGPGGEVPGDRRADPAVHGRPVPDGSGAAHQDAGRASRRPRCARFRLSLRLLLAGIVVILAGTAIGFVQFAESAARYQREAATRTDGIVVLTGGAGRVAAGLDLLRGDVGDRLLISGVHEAVVMPDLLDSEADAAACCIDLGYVAGNTVGNAYETADWVARNGYRSLTVVTSGYHMPRALVELRAVLGDEIHLEPLAVDSASVPLEEWWRWPGTARLLAGEYAKYLLALVRAGWHTV